MLAEISIGKNKRKKTRVVISVVTRMFLSLVYVLSYILGVKSIASEIRIYHPTICLVIILMLNPVYGQVDKPKLSEYTEWTSWTECSKTCSNGIQIRTRDCIQKNTSCTTIEKQIKVCHNQDCRGKVIDSRDEQCRLFNKKVISGRRYYWSSYINDRRQCQLYCKATYYGFYRKFADKVEDGTECEESTGEGICVDGQCKDENQDSKNSPTRQKGQLLNQ